MVWSSKFSISFVFHCKPIKLKYTYSIVFVLIITLSVKNLNAQFIQKGLNDSLFGALEDTMRTYIYYENPADFELNLQPLDTSLDVFQRYDPALKGYDIFAVNANIGQPHHSLFYRNIFNNPFDLGERFLSSYFYNSSIMPYYKLKVPYSEINYVMGSKKENYLNFTLGNQISQGLYFGLDVNVESGLGTFINQQTKNQHYRAVVISSSRDGHYHLKANYIHNKMKWGENGGLVNDAYYEDTTRLDRRILSVNLQNASNNMNSNYLSFNQSYLFNDSTHNRGGFVLDIEYLKNYRIYSDYYDVSNYYQNSFIDSTQSFDSTNSKRLSGFFGWNRKADSLGLSYKVGVQNTYNEYFNGKEFFAFNYLIPTVYLKYETANFLFNASGKYHILQSTNSFSYNNNRIEIAADLTREMGKSVILKVEGNYFSGETEFMNLRYYSNHFMWKNDFSKQNNYYLNAIVDIKGYQISAKYLNINNYVYYNDSIMPTQFDGGLNITSFALAKEFRFKSFGTNLMALYQKVDKEAILRLPELTTRASIFFSFPLFKGALIAHPGFDITYLSAYYADGYNPATMAFYVQNERKIDAQVYADLFVNFKIKRARVFLMYKNFNMLFGTYNYFMMLHYPQQDPSFKLGLSWRFYD